MIEENSSQDWEKVFNRDVISHEIAGGPARSFWWESTS
jgi:hypothetical protein